MSPRCLHPAPCHPSLGRLKKHRLTEKTSGWLGCGTCCSPDAGPWCCPCHCGHIPTPSAARAGKGAGVCAASAAAGHRRGQGRVRWLLGPSKGTGERPARGSEGGRAPLQEKPLSSRRHQGSCRCPSAGNEAGETPGEGGVFSLSQPQNGHTEMVLPPVCLWPTLPVPPERVLGCPPSPAPRHTH